MKFWKMLVQISHDCVYAVIVSQCLNYFKDFLVDEIDVEVGYFQLFYEQIKLSLIVRLMKKMEHGVCLINWKALRSIIKHRFESIHKMIRLKREKMMDNDDEWWQRNRVVKLDLESGYDVWILLWQSKAFNRTTSWEKLELFVYDLIHSMKFFRLLWDLPPSLTLWPVISLSSIALALNFSSMSSWSTLFWISSPSMTPLSSGSSPNPTLQTSQMYPLLRIWSPK